MDAIQLIQIKQIPVYPLENKRIYENHEQLNIINSIETYDVMVDAVAGSGKTTTILRLAQEYQNKHILQITYNSQLKLEVREKAEKMGITNLEIHTYHSLYVKYYDPESYTDQYLHNIINNMIQGHNIHIKHTPSYDIIVIDEAQDMTNLYFKCIKKFIIDSNNVNSRLLLMGDRYQCIYRFKSADYRYLTLGDRIWNKPMIYLTLNTTYRLTDKISKFINICIHGENKLISYKTSVEKVDYIICNPYKIANYLYETIRKYNPDDVFILCPSIKSANSPYNFLEHVLVSNGIPCFVPNSDSFDLDEHVLTGKVVFTTFHQSKGRERPLVIIYGFDDNYFNFYSRNEQRHVCPPELYVALTRASEKLILISSNKSLQLPFLKNFYQSSFLNIYEHNKYLPKAVPEKHIDKIYHQTCVTQLIAFIKDKFIHQLNILLNSIWTLTIPKYEYIQIPNQIYTGYNLYENVSDINGIVIPLTYQSSINNIYKYIMDNKTKIGFLTEYINKIEYPCITIHDYIYISIVYVSLRNKLINKIAQINTYDWITEDHIRRSHEILMRHIPKDIIYEYDGNSVIQSEYGEIHIEWCIDGIHNNQLWEFKCVDSLTMENFLQACLYLYLINMKYPNKYTCINLLNIKTGEMYTLQNNDASNLVIKNIFDILCLNKFEVLNSTDDEQFILNN